MLKLIYRDVTFGSHLNQGVVVTCPIIADASPVVGDKLIMGTK